MQLHEHELLAADCAEATAAACKESSRCAVHEVSIIASTPSSARVVLHVTQCAHSTGSKHAGIACASVDEVQSQILSDLDKQQQSPMSSWGAIDGGVWLTLPLDPPLLQQVERSLMQLLGQCESAVHTIPHSTLVALRSSYEQRCVDVTHWLNSCLDASLRSLLHEHQLDGVRFGLACNGRFLLADAMGTGKTLTALATSLCCCKKQESPMLVVAPKSLRVQWANEVERWMPWLSPQNVRVLQDSRRSAFLDALQSGKANISHGSTIVISSFRMVMQQFHRIRTINWGCVVVDEGHKLHTHKRNNPKEARCVLSLVAHVPHAIIITGTPSLRKPFDVYNLVESLRPGTLGVHKHEFARRYCAIQSEPLRTLRLEELNMLLRETVMLRRQRESIQATSRSCFRHVIELQVDTPYSDRRRACECHLAGRSKLHTAGLSKVNAISEWLCTRILLDGQFEHQNQRHQTYCTGTTSNRIQRTKVAIFAHHIDVLDTLQRMLAPVSNFVRIDGSIDERERVETVLAFQQRNDIHGILISMTAAAEGIDLSRADYAVFAELPPDVATLLQAEARAVRGANRACLPIYYITCLGSCDIDHWINLQRALSSIAIVHDGSVRDGNALQADDVQRICVDEDETCEVADPSLNLPACALRRPQTIVDSGEFVNTDPTQATKPWFEVSVNTRRFHLLRETTDGFVMAGINFVPEEILANGPTYETLDALGLIPACRRMIAEWSCLRTQEQAKLRQRPIATPLSECLAAVQTNQSPDWSTHRIIQADHLLTALPPGGYLKQVTIGSSHQGKQYQKHAVFSADGNRVCNTCAGLLPTSRTDTVLQHTRELFCSDPCATRYMHRTKRTGLREDLFALERGVCQRCSRDCHAFAKLLQVHGQSQRKELILQFDARYRSHPDLLLQLAHAAHEGNAWHADHIVPVSEGGGECGLDNMQTLCTMCHIESTRSLARRQAKRKRKVQSRAIAADEVQLEAEDKADFRT